MPSTDGMVSAEFCGYHSPPMRETPLQTGISWTHVSRASVSSASPSASVLPNSMLPSTGSSKQVKTCKGGCGGADGGG